MLFFGLKFVKKHTLFFLKHHYSTYIMTQSDSDFLTLNVRIRS